jgi:catechol 2,3-dioxygenase-like lactoylglutathione lyase family enzyme
MKLDFNHAMVYVSDVAQAKRFYVDQLGFRLIEEAEGFYARLRSPGSTTTIALHKREPGVSGMRLYFEVQNLDAFCARLVKQGVRFDKGPQDMPWGWRHAYLRDPEGHEISLYLAGRKRLRASLPPSSKGKTRQRRHRGK